MLLICNSILEKELKTLENYFSIKDIVKAYEKAKGGLGNIIKGSPFKKTILRKIYITSKGGAGRIVFLLVISKNIITPVILRLKKDKLIGDNLSIKNKKFEKLLNNNLDLIFSDIKSKNFEII